MPKRHRTPDPQIVMYEDGTFYVRIGDKERSLGTKDFGEACKKKSVEIAKLDVTGRGGRYLRCRDIWPDYEELRKAQRDRSIVVEAVRGQARRIRKPISPGTFKEIQNYWRLHLGPFFEDVRVDKLIDDETWDEFVDQSTLVDLSNARKVWRGFLKYCKKKRFIKYIPDLETPGVERRPRRVLKANEIRELFKHARGNLLVFVSMYLFMGMRRKEIMTLKWSDIHLAERYLVLRKSEVKIRRGRPLPINDFVQELLVARIEAQRQKGIKTDFVFPNAKSPKRHADVSGLKTAWKRVAEKCGWEPGYITPHDLRATFEAFAHKAPEFTDTQREKFAGAAIDVQKKTYVNFDAHDIRGLEAVVKVEGLKEILSEKVTGNERGERENEILH